jgi:tetraacyldisaccharide 4'-kinase
MTDRKKFALVLWPLSLIYRGVVGMRNFLYDTQLLSSETFSIPVISVGNITVGGTGKTPHIEYLVRLLQPQLNLAVLSRGYKRKSKGFRMGEVGSDVDDIGDEPLQIKQKYPEATVAVDRKRVNGIKQLLQWGKQEGKPIEAVLLDDAFQHRSVAPGLSVLLIDYNNPIDEDYLMPLGNLREPEFSKHRANLIVISKCPETLKPIDCSILSKRFKVFPHQTLFFTILRYGNPIAVFPDSATVEPTVNNAAILLITGIARPEKLFDHVKLMAEESELIAFPDHHFFDEKDVSRIVTRFEPINNADGFAFTTEKDAIRFRSIGELLPETLKSRLFYIPIEVEFLYDGKEKFDSKILTYVKQNKKHSSFS